MYTPSGDPPSREPLSRLQIPAVARHVHPPPPHPPNNPRARSQTRGRGRQLKHPARTARRHLAGSARSRSPGSLRVNAAPVYRRRKNLFHTTTITSRNLRLRRQGPNRNEGVCTAPSKKDVGRVGITTRIHATGGRSHNHGTSTSQGRAKRALPTPAGSQITWGGGRGGNT